MQASMFNVRVPLAERNEVFLMNTFTDAQLLVTTDVADLLDQIEARTSPDAVRPLSGEERSSVDLLWEHGFIVPDRTQERTALEAYFRDVRESTDQLRVTVLTTLQCNFACDYCIQGDHGDYNKTAARMSMETAARVADWTEARLDALSAKSFVLTFFGGEPLLNMPVVYYLAERLAAACRERGVRMIINVITNGLLLTPEMVERLNPCGLNGVKITLDGDRDAHNRSRPLRGGQGTFDRIIKNIREISHLTKVSIGGNFDMDTAESYPVLLDFLAEQEFADKLARVSFKPVIREKSVTTTKGMIPLTVVGAEGKPLNGACMTSAGTGVNRVCDSCNFVDEKMAFLRDETKKRGFATTDGVHMGPCEIHHSHSHTIGPDGSLFACPGFAGEAVQSVGHIDGRQEEYRSHALLQFQKLSAWEQCNDCAFIPVCAGGCTVASHNELGDRYAPNCHKTSFEAGVATMAREAVEALAEA